MDKYKVKLSFIYSDVVHVEADNAKDAERKALEECREEYECFYNSDIELEF